MLEIGRPVSPSFLSGGENQPSPHCFSSARSCKKIQDDSLRNIIAWHKNTRSKASTFANGRGKVRDILDALGSTGEILASCAIDRYVSNTVTPRIYITVRNLRTTCRGVTRVIERQRWGLTHWITFRTVNCNYTELRQSVPLMYRTMGIAKETKKRMEPLIYMY